MSRTPVHHDSHPAWAWLILTVFIILYVAGYDTWAVLTGHETMSGRFRDWLFNPVTGPFIFAAWIASYAGLTFHWFLRNTGNR